MEVVSRVGHRDRRPASCVRLAAAPAAIRWREAVMSKSGAAAAADAECADSDRLCDYKDCRKPLHKLLFCSKCKRTAYCCRECQVRPVGP